MGGLTFWLIVVGANILWPIVQRIIRSRWGYWNFFDCRWAIRNIPRGGRLEGPPPSEWPDHDKRQAYWPKKYGGPWA